MSSKKASPTTRHGACLCESVQISVTGVDKGAVICHCVNCRKATGSSYAHNLRFTHAKVDFIKGEELCKQYADSATKTGNTLNRHFCSNCSSTIYLTNSAFNGFVVLPVGIVDKEEAQPFMELFKEDKYSWVGEVTQKPRL